MTDMRALRGGEGLVWRRLVDFGVYRGGGAAYAEGLPIYSMGFETQDIVLPFTYPPLAAALFAPLRLLPVGLGGALLNLASAVVLWAVIALFLRSATPLSDVASRRWALVAAPVCAFLEPASQTFDFGQINILLMGLVAYDALGPGRVPRGMLAGLAAAVKLTPAVFGLYFLLRRDWAAAARMVATAVALTLLSALPNFAVWREYWFSALGSPERIGGLAYSTNQSATGAIVRLTGDQQTGVWLVAVAATIAAVTVSGILLARRSRNAGASAAASPATAAVPGAGIAADADPGAANAGAGAADVGADGDAAAERAVPGGAAPGTLVLVSLVALVCSPVSWSHHWVWLIPAALVTALSGTTAGRVWAGLAVLAMAVQPHTWLPRGNNVEMTWSIWQHLAGSSYLLLAVALIVLALLSPRVLLRPGASRGEQAADAARSASTA
ncbi:glycosyltransferase 87 family protein [Corynebacterium frankenforstense]